MNNNKEKELLQKEYDNLIEEYITLIERTEDRCYKDREYLESLCLHHFGTIAKQKLDLCVEIKKNIRKTNALQIYINQKSNKDLESIYKEIEGDLINFDKEIEAFDNKLEYSIAIMNCEEISGDEKEEIREKFNMLAKRLNPFSSESKSMNNNLWIKCINAYKINDLATLNLLLNIFDNKSIESDKNEEQLKSLIKKIGEENSKLARHLEVIETEFPFNIEDKLEDKDWIEDEKKKMNNAVKNLKIYRDNSEQKLKYMEIYYTV